MSLGRRVRDIAIGILKAAVGVILISTPEDGHVIVSLLLGVSLLIYGIRNIIYYFTMARFMVGGRMILYLGVLILDAAGVFAILADSSTLYIMIYLIAIYFFSGVIDLLRALEEKQMFVSAWKIQLVSAVVNLLVVVACIIFIKSEEICVYIYAGGLIYSALAGIIAAIRAPKASLIL